VFVVVVDFYFLKVGYKPQYGYLKTRVEIGFSFLKGRIEGIN